MIKRTPDDRFDNIPDYPFAPNYFDWGEVRLHYLDDGEGPPVVLFHGEPTWSFLYRKIIPVLVASGYRAIAPDYFGFGKSDKPIDPDAYTYDAHTESMTALLRSLDISGACAVVQDWGGPIGLRVATENPDMFGHLSILNTGLFTGGKVSEGFMAWRNFVEKSEDLPIRFIMERSMIQQWPDEVLEAYEAPYPDRSYKEGAHRFPLIVPIADDHDGVAEMKKVKDALASWAGGAQVMFSTEDPVFVPKVGERFVERIPNATALELVEGAGHFLQEDQAEEVGRRIVAFLDGA